MRSVQTLGSVHAQRDATSLSRLADPFGTAESCSSARLCFTHHLPASLRSTPITALPGYYGGSDFLHLPPLRCRISLIHTTRASDRSASKHLMTFDDRFHTLFSASPTFP